MTNPPGLVSISAIPFPAVLIGPEAKIAAANPEAINLLGAGLVGRHFALVMRQPDIGAGIENALRHNRRQRIRQRIGAPDSSLLYDVEIRPDGDGVLVCFQDMTAPEQAERMRRDFVANVSHELRSPLTALTGFIDTLRGPARDDVAARERFLGIMADEAARMNRLVGDLLSLSRVEEHERVRPRGRVDLTGLLTTTLNALRPTAEKNGVTLSLQAPDDPVDAPGDADQLRQVFNNLVENAVKYGGAGGTVDLRLSVSDHDGAVQGPAVRVQVVDHGAGIPAHHLPRLTERFYRADSHRSRELGGTGLGLAIVKHIINRHRGRLRIESEVGRGSVFTVILPR
ncbi:sensor histidine kinase [Pukyongiella litopenaei]|uniref:histidine kinase n=1 Tax=Pukyongiella litopenaei TaxID=2605946 RepID=A0A2S0MKM2_9RHOB|nr:ATP-binding protein [Pukyongiella litopenaei]AVO36435.1 two-component sensor histidine kinase [Pukyongiella litopenaei]